MSLQVSILGGDRRHFYMMESLLSDGTFPDIHFTYFHTDFPKNHLLLLKKRYPEQIIPCFSLESLFAGSTAAVLPIPFRKDEMADIPTVTLLSQKLPPLLFSANLPDGFFPETVTAIDFLKDPGFLEKNSALTAEGLLKYLIEETDISIRNARILITGYGHCGKEIAKRLVLLQAEIFIYDREPARIQEAKKQHLPFFSILEDTDFPADFDMVINTVPHPVFKAPFLRSLPGHCRLFDIASAPGGFDRDICEGLSLFPVRCPGIPGKTAPYSSGKAMGETVAVYLKKASLL